MVAEIKEPSTRKLVTIRIVKAIDPIPNADAIEVVTVDGWKVVAKKGDFVKGDLCVYFEIDSFLPKDDPRYSFLMNNGVRTFNGVIGHRLRTVKLRGQISQGLIMPVLAFPEIVNYLGCLFGCYPEYTKDVFDLDFTDVLNIKKWEPELPAELAGLVKGLFPGFIAKTDQERCQNISDEIFADVDAQYEVSVKLDGTSCTIYHRNGEIGVCSRNLELKICPENYDNAFVKVMYDNKLDTSLLVLGRNVAIQGEVMGPGIQKNREQLKKPTLFVFDVYDIDRGEYMSPVERKVFVDQLRIWHPELLHVPVLHESISLNQAGLVDVNGLLEHAEGPSLTHPVREGLVWKRIDGMFSFKAISNTFLAKEKD